MGRKEKFVASKSFTLGLTELQWLSEFCNKNDMKASEKVNQILREAMLKDKAEGSLWRESTGASCDKCDAWTQHTKDFLCLECKEINTKLKEQWWKAIQIPNNQQP